jgi:hypothetical protein
LHPAVPGNDRARAILSDPEPGAHEMTTTRRIDAGPLLVLAGAVLLLISLFLAWYEPSLEAWDIFELVDVLLAAAGLTAILAALGLLADFPSAPDPRVLPWLSVGALVLVLATLLDRPPVVEQGDADVGLWLALAAAALMAAGTLLGLARVSIALDVAARERRQRVEAVDARPADLAEQTAPTEPLPPSREGTPP